MLYQEYDLVEMKATHEESKCLITFNGFAINEPVKLRRRISYCFTKEPDGLAYCCVSRPWPL